MKEKHRMTSGQWLVAFVLTVVLLGLSVLGFNYITDPFGAFGDRFFQWWSYDETMNPRVAKIEYLEQNHELYDSYIIGCSSTSSWPVEGFNEYFDARFYNMIMYGADMLDVELMSKYLIEHYEVKNLVVNIYINNAEEYNTESDPLTYNLNYKVDGTSRWDFYKKYLFLNPRYGLEKLSTETTAICRRPTTCLTRPPEPMTRAVGTWRTSAIWRRISQRRSTRLSWIIPRERATSTIWSPAWRACGPSRRSARKTAST